MCVNVNVCECVCEKGGGLNHNYSTVILDHLSLLLYLDFFSLLLDLGLLALNHPLELGDTLGELIRYTYLFGLCVNHLPHHTSLLFQNAFLFL